MPELERDLRLLGRTVELAAEPDLARLVRLRISEPARRRFPLRPLAVALAALTLALGAAFAVPQARSAILRLLGLEHVTIVRVEKLPPVTRGPGAVGERLSLEDAERQLGFHALLPDLGRPDAVYVGPGGEVLVLLYGRPVRLRLSELLARFPIEKLVTPSERVESVRVGGHPGLWIPGPHVVIEPFGQPRVEGSVLVWQRNGLTLRLEGHVTKGQALRLASSIR